MNKIKKNAKRIVYFIAAVFIPVAILFNLAETAWALEASPIEMANIKADYDNAARAEHAAYKLYQCVDGDYWWDTYYGDGYNYDNTFSSDSEIFKTETFSDRGLDAYVGLTSLSAGRWLEEQVQGEFDDGMIDCGDNGDHIIDVFASLIGKSRNDVLCDGSAPGIVKNADGGSCGDSSAEYVKADDRLAHVQKLYDEYIADKSDYPVTWSVLSGNSFAYTYVDGYYLYSLDVERGCGGSLGVTSTATEEPSRTHSPTALKRLDDYANVTYEWFVGKGGDALSSHGFVSRADGWTCKQYIERANEDDMFGSFRTLMLEKIKEGCYQARKEQVAEAQDNFNRNKADMTDEDKAADQKILDDANALISSYESGNKDALVEPYKDDEGNHPDDANRGLMCKQIEGLPDVGMKTYELDAEDEAEPDCYTNAGSLGWVLCPIINQGGEFVTSVYEKMIEPFLVLDSGLFNRSETGGSATYKAWTQFQTYANIAFIAVFLVVIFSQLTGYGIDNYGIKKILPKLIIAAILINLSYIICQAAIDIANVAGYGIKTILDGIGKVNLSSMTTAEAPTAHPAMAAGATAILVGLVALITIPAILSQGTAILVPVFIAIVGIVIAVFTLFCLLAVRKAFAVILVVVSPMAFLCYMLPNTKKIYDKWFTAFKAVLIAFPICSAMVYGGQAVARILVQAAGGSNMPFLMVLSAAVMSIAPVFLIPGTLKKSMGAISGAIDRVSHGASHRARGGIARSNLAHDLQRRGQLQRSGIKVDKDGNVKYTARGRLQNKLAGSKLASSASKQRLAAARADAIRTYSSSAKGEEYIGASGLDKMNAMYSSAQAAQDKQHVSDLEASYKLGNETLNGEKVEYRDVTKGGSLQRALQHAIMTGDKDRVKALSNIAAGQGDKGRSVIKNAMKEADAAAAAFGDDDAGKAQKAMMAEGKQALASNIMDNYAGSFKENARSTYDWAANNQTDGADDRTMASYEDSVSTGSLRGSHMNNMDDDDFGALMKRKAELEAMAASGTALSNEQKADYNNILAAAAAGKTDQSFTATKVERQQGVESLSKMSDANTLWDKATKEAKLEAKRNTSAWNTATESEEAYKNRIKQTLLEQTKKNLGR